MAAAAHSSNGHYDTIVIGAGMSGLSCAARLYQHPQYQRKNALLVLEGRDRIGGRIGSVHVNGCRLDTGANWIHGTGTEDNPNPLLKILPHKKYRELAGRVSFRAPAASNESTRAGMDATPPNHDWHKVDGVGTAQRPAGNEQSSDLVIPGEVSDSITGALWAMAGSLHELADSASPEEAKRTTMLEAIMRTKELKQGFANLPTEYHRTFGSMPQFLEGMEAAPLVAQSAEHPEGQPGMSLLEFKTDDFEGDQVFLRDGYMAVIDEVAKDLMKAGTVRCGVKVRQIKWTTNPMTIETNDGIYSARQIPLLPNDKRQAISCLGFGTLDKIFLVYDEPWWIKEPYISIFEKGMSKNASYDMRREGRIKEGSSMDSFIGFTDELPGLIIHEDGTLSSGARMMSLINLHNLTGYPVLSCFSSCHGATEIETMSDEQAAGIVHRALTKWLGIEPPKPAAVHATRWAQDEFSRGSYSHMITGMTEKEHRGAFQAPVKNKDGGALRFAGEHTSKNHFATVHGALLSGWREADDILRQTDERSE